MKLPHRCRALGLIVALAVGLSQLVLAATPRTVTGLGLELMPIPAGSFTMGSPANEPGHATNEGPQTQVTITRPFWLGKYDVTVGQWKTFMGTDLMEQAKLCLSDDTLYSYYADDQKKTLRERAHKEKDSDPAAVLGNTDDNFPMYYVNWAEAAAFCRKLTDRERAAGRLPAGYEYRLPTEAEWEYACRAGTTTATYAGEMVIAGEANAPVLDAIAWYRGNSSVDYSGRGWSTATWVERQHPGGDAGPHAVGTKLPNEWGLYDMLGNVFQWCSDWYPISAWYAAKLPGGSISDPRGPETGAHRVGRGGAWDHPPKRVRAATRGWWMPGQREPRVGFRVALAPSLP